MKHRTHLAIVASLTLFVASAGAQGLQLDGGTVEIKPIITEAVKPVPVKTPPANPDAVAPKSAKSPTEIIAREASLDNQNHIAIFSGEVDVKDPQFNMNCDKLTLHLKKPKPAAKPAESGTPKAGAPTGAKPAVPAPAAPAAKPAGSDGESKIEKAIAEGKVIIVQDKPDADGKMQHYIGKGQKAVYEPDKKTCTLTGWPRVAQSVNGSISKEIVSKEEGCVIIMNQAGRIDVHGYHITRLVDTGALEEKPQNKTKAEDGPFLTKPDDGGVRPDR